MALHLYAGRQGSGKSISMTERLEQIRKNEIIQMLKF